MFTMMKQMLSDVIGQNTSVSWKDDSMLWKEDPDVRAYFTAEYKSEAKSAYEYWLTTNNSNYATW